MLKEKTLSKLKSMIKQAKINCVDNTDEQALEVQVLYPDWEEFEDGTEFAEGDRMNYAGTLYKVKQAHAKQSTWNPKDSATLFTPINATQSGTIDNPITWVTGMEAEKDLYYIDEGIKYLCIESSGVGLYAQPKDLPRYFQVVTE